jgi:CRISPR-associated Cas5-like protein
MVWIGARYRFASTFSYRIPYFSSSYALSAPAPSPSTVKLALVSATINRTGNIQKGARLFEKIHNSSSAIELPNKVAVFKAFMKRLKKKRLGDGFERTFGIREYILYDGALGIHLDVASSDVEEVSEALQRVQYFGTSDSICYCFEKTKAGPDQKHVVSQCGQNQALSEGVVFLLSDFSENTTFEDINPFSEKRMKRESLSLKPHLFPMRVVQKDRSHTIYQRL